MTYLLTVCRVLLLMLSFYGYMQFLSKKLRPEFALGVLLTGIGSVMFLAGILNLLAETAWVVLAIGILLAVRSVFRRESVRDVLSVGTVCFAGLGVLFAVLLYGSKFVRYDDFSHWATVVKLMLQKDRFPNFSDANILFQSYPPGSAAFIYYIAKVTGITAEWMQMYAQAMLTAGVLTGLFAFAKRVESHLLVGVTILMLMCSNGPFTSLLVDTLLPAVAVGGIALCMYEKEQLADKVLWLIPYMVFLMSVKNSGIFFVLILLVYALICVKKQKGWYRKFLCSAVSPFAALLLWQKHVKLVFADGMQAKHSMSVEHFETVFGDKTSEQLHTIFTGVLGKMFSLSNGMLYLLLFMVVVWLLQRFLLHTGYRDTMRAGILILVSYLAYQLGLFGMYLFTMPTEEALVLASYDRYHQTILIFLIGILCIQTVQQLERLSARNLGRIGGILGAALSFGVSWGAIRPQVSCYQRQQLAGTERAEYDALIAAYDFAPDSSYLVLIDAENPNASYLKFMGKYLFDSNDVTVKTVEKAKNLTDYDYVILFDQTAEVNDLVEVQLGISGQRVIGQKQ